VPPPLVRGGRMMKAEVVDCRWLPFLDTYRTMCLAPKPEFRRVLEEIRAMRIAA
jgi:hypothetical protein